MSPSNPDDNTLQVSSPFRVVQVWIHEETAGFEGYKLETGLYEAWRELLASHSAASQTTLLVSNSVRDRLRAFVRWGAQVAISGVSIIPFSQKFNVFDIPELQVAIEKGEDQLKYLIEQRNVHPLQNEGSGEDVVDMGELNVTTVDTVFVSVSPFISGPIAETSIYEPHQLDLHIGGRGRSSHARFLAQLVAPSLDWSLAVLSPSFDPEDQQHQSHVIEAVRAAFDLAGKEYFRHLVSNQSTPSTPSPLPSVPAPSSAPLPNITYQEISEDPTVSALNLSGSCYIYSYGNGQYAAKVMDVHNVHREVALMELAGNYSIKPLAFIRLPNSYNVVTGYKMKLERPLADVVQEDKDSLDDQTKLKWLQEILVLVRGIHSNGVIHGDINMHNMLLCTADNRLRLCDFGISAFMTESWYPHAYTERYYSAYRIGPSPKGSRKLRKEEDIFALGVIGWELFNVDGKKAHEGLEEDEVYELLVNQKKGLDLEKIENQEAKTFVKMCFDEAMVLWEGM